MTDTISYSGLAFALLAPWLLGSVWVYSLVSKSGRWNWFLVLGHGYFIGIFLTVSLILLWDYLGLALGFQGIAATLTVITVAGGLLSVKKAQSPRDITAPETLSRWHICVISLLLGLLFWRYSTLLQEILLRPLYSWDSWMNWAPKAIVWFHQQQLTEFISPHEWLQEPANTASYTLGNYAAFSYPPAIPLIQLWCMLGAGVSDHSSIYLPWLMAPIATGLALYGHLRLAGVSILAATIACYILLNIPYINVHSALPGYADLWLATAFGMAAFSLYEWDRSRHWSYAVLCLVMAVLCCMLKKPGVFLGFIILLAFLRSVVNLSFKTELIVAAVLIGTGLFLATSGISLDLPLIGHISIDGTKIATSLNGNYTLELHPVSGAYVETLFVSANWHMLWYWLIILLFFKAFSGDIWRQPSPLSAVAIGAIAFIAFIFSFTNYYSTALNFTTLNRAILYVLPTLIFFAFLHLRRQNQTPEHSPGATTEQTTPS